MSEEAAKADCVIIGDQMSDLPLDALILFFEEEEAFPNPAWVIEKVLNAVVQENPSDLTAAFKSLLGRGVDKNKYSNPACLDMEGGIEISMNYSCPLRNHDKACCTVPTISISIPRELTSEPRRFAYDPEKWKSIAAEAIAKAQS
ncbi:MAG: hypothetical protein WCK00_04390 [Deltaproteobacteria bacterium]